MKKLGYAFFTIVAIFILFQGCNPFNATYETFKKVIEVKPKSQLFILNQNGNIKIELNDQEKISVRAEKKSLFGRKELKKVDILIKEDNDKVEVETLYLDQEPNVTVDFFIKVPTSIFVSEIKSKNGNISVKQTKGDLLLQTTNGSIEVYQIDGWISAITKNGSIKASKITGFKEILTTNGSIETEIANIPQEGSRIVTNNANIKLKILFESGMFLDLATSNGSINVNGIIEKVLLKNKNQHQSKVKEGGKLLFVRTENGNIEISK